MTNHTETSAHKPSAVETLKDKAANLVNKVTGKSHGHNEATHTHTEPLDQHKHSPAATTTTGTHQDHHHTSAAPTSIEHDKHNVDHGKHNAEHDQHTAEHGKVNPSAFLTSVRLPDLTASTGGAAAPAPAAAGANTTVPSSVHEPIHPQGHGANVSVPSAVHDPSHPQGHTAGHTEGLGSHIPTHAHNAAANAAGIAPSAVGHEHDHRRTDDPQHAITSSLVGDGRDPNNLETAHIKPTM
ncbi:hypothetical protein BGZ68_000295 [Mortierella alpina]|nr:hypothetical protein BGZ68_000295 [Mortierella alpina]